jgi:hypothetical protein
MALWQARSQYLVDFLASFYRSSMVGTVEVLPLSCIASHRWSSEV